MRRVLEDVRHDTAAANAASETNGSGETNGASTNGNGNKNGATEGGGGSLAIPEAVVEAVLKTTRECLDSVCEVDDSSTAG